MFKMYVATLVLYNHVYVKVKIESDTFIAANTEGFPFMFAFPAI